MKNRYEVRAIIIKKDGTGNSTNKFCDTLEQAQATVCLIQTLCAADDREYMLKIIDTTTHEIVKAYES